ncbi:MAG: PIN domain-containing protein [Candidatus Woesearchaeota archaeon]|jgi:rRNA-processing protein FCF1
MIFTTKTKVILDTNFILIPGTRGVDILSEIERIMSEPYEICVLDKSIEELEKIVQKSGKKKEGFSAKLGLILLKQKNLKTLTSSSEEYADKAILAFAAKNPEKTIVATQDKGLKDKLKDISVRVIQLRQEKYLVLG